MTRQSLFGSPLFLGFDHLEQMLDRVTKNADGYPPYNIEQIRDASGGESGLRITLAVAGFSMDDLQITQEDNQLVIRGRQKEDGGERVFLHRGIAARQFQRAFVLAEGIEVEGAWLDNGLLHIDLKRPQPESRVKTIRIASKGNGVIEKPIVEGRADRG
jgi:HSP20 family molecular chaperone IbpA